MPAADTGTAPLLLGLALGMRHALDADHLVAMSTIVTRERSALRASLLGGAWGVGHCLSLFAVGLAVLVFRIPMGPAFGHLFERLVGVMLVALGATSLLPRIRRNRGNEGTASGLRSHRRPFGIGLVHGLAGSGALAIAVLMTIPSRIGGLLYITLFGVGAVGGMMGVTGILALPLRLGAVSGRNVGRWVSVAASVGSVVFGIYYLHQCA